MNPQNRRGPSEYQSKEPQWKRPGRQNNDPHTITPQGVAYRLRTMSVAEMATIWDPIGFGNLCPRCMSRGTFAALDHTRGHCSRCHVHTTSFHLGSRILHDHRALARAEYRLGGGHD